MNIEQPFVQCMSGQEARQVQGHVHYFSVWPLHILSSIQFV